MAFTETPCALAIFIRLSPDLILYVFTLPPSTATAVSLWAGAAGAVPDFGAGILILSPILSRFGLMPGLAASMAFQPTPYFLEMVESNSPLTMVCSVPVATAATGSGVRGTGGGTTGLLEGTKGGGISAALSCVGEMGGGGGVVGHGGGSVDWGTGRPPVLSGLAA